MIASPQREAGELRVLAETDEIVALCLAGEFDLTNAPLIIEEGERLLADDKHVILDLSDASFIDVAVIHALSRIGAAAKRDGHVVILQLGTAPMVERIIELTGIGHVLPGASTRAESLKAIRQLRRPA